MNYSKMTSLIKHLTNHRNSFLPLSGKIQIRTFWEYVNIAFNRVDADRLKEVGPDRLCAEWILKNDGTVRFTDNPSRKLVDYNTIPGSPIKVKEIDATGACIMKIGFEHLKGCKFVDKIILKNCKYLENEALEGLVNVKDTLKHLEVSSCNNISDSGLAPISELKNLETLVLNNLQFVVDLNAVTSNLKKSLPKCTIEAK